MTIPSIFYRFYGRRVGKKITPEKRQALQKKLDEACFPLWNPQESLAQWPALHLEIGFGQGEHLLEQARRHPHLLFVGCEAFQDGVNHLWHAVTSSSMTNIRIFPQDARLLMDQLPDGVVESFYILFPDPWPKKRHQKRRMVYSANLGHFRRLLKQGGKIHVATDHEGYASAIQRTLQPSEGFSLIEQEYALPSLKQNDWPSTRYEQKALAKQKKCYYLVYEYCRDSGSPLSIKESNPSAQ